MAGARSSALGSGSVHTIKAAVRRLPGGDPAEDEEVCYFWRMALDTDKIDEAVLNPIVGRKSKNPHLQEWHTKNLERLPGLKFMRTLWVCDAAGGPFEFTATKPGRTPLGLEEAHRDLRISPAEFDEVAAELGRTLDFFKVPKREKAEVLAAFAAHKDEVTAGQVGTNR